MQIVIELDKEDYEKIKKTSFVENTETMLNQSSEDRKGTMMLFRIIDAIKDGTPIDFRHSLEYKQGAIDCINIIQNRLREIEI